MSGFEVEPEELRQFAGKLDSHHNRAGEIAGLVAMADVGDRSWGVVGLLTKGEYTQRLAELKDLFADMQTGLQSGAAKFRGTADGYAEQEEALKKIFNGIQVEIDRK
ncbi:WXG100 family type VII secretion target [Lentzea sp. HUAS12]|uniref:WXG100 family type VII secretion target n=1 Tax=Lentzea sp. HUAS12 TaxID=2951806 RepID=UPI00209CFA4E|nr:ESX-1 secretion-associated protein [Lentzea sp. HUAS12]USX49721.1 ESX-1 secretion-associated protein [Lentzea sp. HUAS12]